MPSKKYLINESIKCDNVKLIDETGHLLKECSSDDAIKIAKDKHLDVVLINNGNPPICKIMDYNKFLYNENKKQKKNIQKPIKEIQLSFRIQTNDIITKSKKAIKMLQSGNKIKIVVIARGREIEYKEQGIELINKFFNNCKEFAKIDKPISVEGHNISMTIKPIESKRKEGV